MTQWPFDLHGYRVYVGIAKAGRFVEDEARYILLSTADFRSAPLSQCHCSGFVTGETRGNKCLSIWTSLLAA